MAGFTLLEALIALAAITLITTVLLSAHLQALRAEDEARWMEMARFQVERVMTRNTLGLSVADLSATNQAEWTLAMAPADFRQNAGDSSWQRWEISPTNRPSLKTVFYLRKR